MGSRNAAKEVANSTSPKLEVAKWLVHLATSAAVTNESSGEGHVRVLTAGVNPRYRSLGAPPMHVSHQRARLI